MKLQMAGETNWEL